MLRMIMNKEEKVKLIHTLGTLGIPEGDHEFWIDFLSILDEETRISFLNALREEKRSS
jgi:hypothetical protein